ncbi:hypothetical protein [Komagataeibacter europaeus]|uniref:hypothetical protein n=1 Tax=Komagataeibacter europaeus TaxID=33995 RepID=UPI000380CC29|nr:hypothetical protein [Komagataeibacter europaeus]GBQ39030.1 hypothetical protein AA18890_0334 [Komagataeibacter europaeus LMG 18890]
MNLDPNQIRLVKLSILHDLKETKQAFQVEMELSPMQAKTLPPLAGGAGERKAILPDGSVTIRIRLQTLPATTTEDWIASACSYLHTHFPAPSAGQPVAGG